MMLDLPHDPVFPALSVLSRQDLDRITGVSAVEVLRFRIKPGMRAVLHVALGNGPKRGEGVIWFLGPDKIANLRASHPGLRVDRETGILFEPFPTDHRLPEAARFMADRDAIARTLFATPPTSEPTLVRYRPGLSATFRWSADSTHFLKVVRKARVAEQAAAVTSLARHLDGSALSVAPVSGLSPNHCLIAYRAAEGRPFDDLLRDAAPDAVEHLSNRLVAALHDLWSCGMQEGLPTLSQPDYLSRAARCVGIIATADPVAGRIAQATLDRAAGATPSLRHLPIHADMKLDHAFLSGAQVTLIDTESMHLGDPDRDLSLLDARLDLSLIEGRLDAPRVDTLRRALRSAAGPDYAWFLSLARLHAAKYFAERLHPNRAAILRRMLAA